MLIKRSLRNARSTPELSNSSDFSLIIFRLEQQLLSGAWAGQHNFGLTPHHMSRVMTDQTIASSSLIFSRQCVSWFSLVLLSTLFKHH